MLTGMQADRQAGGWAGGQAVAGQAGWQAGTKETTRKGQGRTQKWKARGGGVGGGEAGRPADLLQRHRRHEDQAEVRDVQGALQLRGARGLSGSNSERPSAKRTGTGTARGQVPQ